MWKPFALLHLFPTHEFLLQIRKIKYQSITTFKDLLMSISEEAIGPSGRLGAHHTMEPNAAAITITVMADTSGPILVIRVRLWLTLMEMQTYTHIVASCNLAKWMLHHCATLSHLLPSQYVHFRQEQNSA